MAERKTESVSGPAASRICENAHFHKGDPQKWISLCFWLWKKWESCWNQNGDAWDNSDTKMSTCVGGYVGMILSPDCLWIVVTSGAATEATAICAHTTLPRHLPSNYLFNSGFVPHFAMNHRENNSHFKILDTVFSHFVFADFLSCHWHGSAVKYICHQLNNPILIPTTHRIVDRDWLLNLFSWFPHVCTVTSLCTHTDMYTQMH